MHINIFDFDGVLADPLEEGLFNLPITSDGERLIEKMSQRHKMDLSGESLKSAHYISMQAALWDSCVPIMSGPKIDETKAAPYYILTARSDRFAVARMQEFIQALPDPYRPIKIMHVDHLPKGQMLKMMLDRHPDNTYSFYDDRAKHIDSALALCSPRLDVFHVDNDMERVYERASTFYQTILDLAL
jgi:hypothetical protein